ncbi:MAG: hypothetical protein ACKVS6_04455 [Planctomycetota bacterium]
MNTLSHSIFQSQQTRPAQAEIDSVISAFRALPTALPNGEMRGTYKSFSTFPTQPSFTTEGAIHLKFSGQYFRSETKCWMFAEGESKPRLVTGVDLYCPKGSYFLDQRGEWEPCRRTDVRVKIDPRVYGRTVETITESIPDFMGRLKYTHISIPSKSDDAWSIEFRHVSGTSPVKVDNALFRFTCNPKLGFQWSAIEACYDDGSPFKIYRVNKLMDVENGFNIASEGSMTYYRKGTKTVLGDTTFNATWLGGKVEENGEHWFSKELSIPKDYVPRWTFGRLEDLASSAPATLPAVKKGQMGNETLVLAVALVSIFILDVCLSRTVRRRSHLKH